MLIMQHKRALSNFGMVKVALGLGVVLIVGFLMTASVPAPQHAIEKELDAKAVLESKPQ